MADAVTTNVIYNGLRHYIVQLTNISDGTGESAVVKVDKSTLTGPNGLEPSQLVVEKIEYVVYDVANAGMQVRLYWNHTTPDLIASLQGSGYFDYMEEGRGLYDPKSAGGTGDITLTTVNHTLGDGYTITLTLRKKD